MFATKPGQITREPLSVRHNAACEKTKSYKQLVVNSSVITTEDLVLGYEERYHTTLGINGLKIIITHEVFLKRGRDFIRIPFSRFGDFS